jgi:hypothetical protein
MLKTIAIVFGIIFIAIGVLGFVPFIAPNGMLLGIFHVGPLHNIVHLISGIAAIAMAMAGEATARLYFKIFGVIYAVVAVLGLFYGNAPLLGIMAHNWADVWLHVIIAGVALYLGFGYRERPAGTSTTTRRL